MQIPTETCPKASPEGGYSHETTISSSPLQAAFAKAFNGQRLDLDRRDIFIHGVPASAKLAASAAFLGLIPASVTLPIACDRIERAAKRVGASAVSFVSCRYEMVKGTDAAASGRLRRFICTVAKLIRKTRAWSPP
jgi:hypothetical protein